MSATPAPPAKTGLTDKILNGVERAGNKLPEPFMLFLILFAVTGVLAALQFRATKKLEDVN